jgi:predicted GNAT superfamily acetyltransferase
MSEINKMEGVTIVGTFDDDQTMVGASQGFPFTWYILADFPDREAVQAACNLLRTIVVGEGNDRLWKYMTVEARMGRALEIPDL